MLFYKNSIIGIEIDSIELKAVELSGSQTKPVIGTYGRTTLPDNIIREGRVIDQSAFKFIVEKLISDNKFKSRDILIGISNPDIIMRFAAFPKVDEDRLKGLVRFQCQEHIPIPISELELDYMVTGELERDEVFFHKVLLVAARKVMLEGYVEAISRTRLRIRDIDSSLLAMGRTSLQSRNVEAAAFFGISCDMLNTLIVSNGLPAMARAVNFGESISSILKSYYNYLITREINNSPVPVEDDFNRLVDGISSEIKASLNYYNNNSTTRIGIIYLLGFGTRIAGLTERLNELFDVQVKAIETLPEIKPEIKTGPNDFYPADYAVCYSLALRGLGR